MDWTELGRAVAEQLVPIVALILVSIVGALIKVGLAYFKRWTGAQIAEMHRAADTREGIERIRSTLAGGHAPLEHKVQLAERLPQMEAALAEHEARQPPAMPGDAGRLAVDTPSPRRLPLAILKLEGRIAQGDAREAEIAQRIAAIRQVIAARTEGQTAGVPPRAAYLATPPYTEALQEIERLRAEEEAIRARNTTLSEIRDRWWSALSPEQRVDLMVGAAGG